MPTAGYPAVGKVYITPMKPQQLRRGKQGETMIGLYEMLDRLDRQGIAYEVTGDDRNSKLVVDGKVVGDVRGDLVYLY